MSIRSGLKKSWFNSQRGTKGTAAMAATAAAAAAAAGTTGLCHVLVAGKDEDSGRAVLCSLFIKDRGTNPEKDKRTVKLDGDANVDVVVEMFHTQYMGLMQTTLRSSEVFLCVYSKYDRTSFAEIAQHLPIMREANEKAKVIVVATDHLESEGRKVEVEKIVGEQFAESHGAWFHEVSLKDQAAVDDVFVSSVRRTRGLCSRSSSVADLATAEKKKDGNILRKVFGSIRGKFASPGSASSVSTASSAGSTDTNSSSSPATAPSVATPEIVPTRHARPKLTNVFAPPAPAKDADGESSTRDSMPETPTFFVRGATGDNLVVTPIFPYDPEPIAEAGEASVAPSKTSPGSSIKNMPSETYESTGEESPNLGANHKLIIDTNSKVSSGHNSGDEQEGDKSPRVSKRPMKARQRPPISPAPNSIKSLSIVEDA